MRERSCLSRTQSMTEEKLQETAALLREHNAKATMITTPWDDLNGKQILDAMHHAELDMSRFHQHEEEDILMNTAMRANAAAVMMQHDDHEHHHDHEAPSPEHEHDHEHDHDHGEGCYLRLPRS